MKKRYAQAMEWLYIACVAVSGAALVAITLMIPMGVFMRYVMHRPLAWPEPASVILMVLFTFLGGAAVYRANGHIAVEALLKAVPPGVRRAMEWLIHALMATMALFMLGYGAHLCVVTRYSSMAEFPSVSVGAVYLPIPVAGLITLAFLVERLWLGPPPKTSIMYSDEAVEVE